MKYSHVGTLKEGLNVYKLASTDDGDDVEIRKQLESKYKEETNKDLNKYIKSFKSVDIIYVLRHYNTNLGFILGDVTNGYVKDLHIFNKYKDKKYDDMFLTYVSEFTPLKKKNVKLKDLDEMKVFLKRGYTPKGMDKDGNLKFVKKDKFKRK